MLMLVLWLSSTPRKYLFLGRGEQISCLLEKGPQAAFLSAGCFASKVEEKKQWAPPWYFNGSQELCKQLQSG